MNKNEIKNWLDRYNIKKYTINNDLTIDVDGFVLLYNKNLIEIPIQFNKVNGEFNCNHNKLTSLKGCPKKVNGFFYCGNNDLISLKYLPDIIKYDLYCDDYLKDSVEYKAFKLLQALRK